MSFKEYQLDSKQKIWLEEILKAGNTYVDAGPLKVRLYRDKLIPEDFQSGLIDQRLIYGGRITLMGIRLVQPDHPLLMAAHRIVESVRMKILTDEHLKRIPLTDIAASTGLTIEEIKWATTLVNHEKGCWSGPPSLGSNTEFSELTFSGYYDFDALIKYKDLDSLLEESWKNKSPYSGVGASILKDAGVGVQADTAFSWSGEVVKEGGAMSKSKNIFLVHGHDGIAKKKVADFIKELGLNPIILHEQPNGGKTIIEKFEAHAAEVYFAVVVMTPDDVAHQVSKAVVKEARARQNVVFEFGYFIGKLGRKNVVAIKEESVAVPSDMDGVIYLPLDDSGEWKKDLVRELKNAGVSSVEKTLTEEVEPNSMPSEGKQTLKLTKIRQHGKDKGWWNLSQKDDGEPYNALDIDISVTNISDKDITITGVEFRKPNAKGYWYIIDTDIHGKEHRTTPSLTPGITKEVHLTLIAEDVPKRSKHSVKGSVCLIDQFGTEHWLTGIEFNFVDPRY
jgi:predicted nucleotide-binding protein